MAHIAIRNVRWLLLLTFALSVQTLLAINSQSLVLRLLAIVYLLPVVAWLVGSVVQRQKIAIVWQQQRSAHAKR